ncbi:hypothetical protein PV10_08845 [Exophiala mesophila]|uniref:Transcription factor domain-containing protein n=1 Tax=Exophiala mesophila TaxID=212818 RepID=A0A0D1XM77_EXOME|nr:uncharacterized protein PV10_08845 [Exophiala mesophila]KIV89266.1 hypothetical protein PV10_08845 [Exophiala mesophila]
MASAPLNSRNRSHDESNLGLKTKSQAQSRYMFVEYAAPAPPPPLGTKRRRGGPSEVRAHITKEFHRRLRVKRLGSLNPLPLRGDDTSDPPMPPPPTHNDQVLATVSTSLPDRTLSKHLNVEEHHEEHDAVPPEKGNATSLLSDDSSDDPQRIGSTGRPPQGAISPTLSASPLLGESNVDPFEVLPFSTAPSFIQHVLKHAVVHSWPQTVPARNNSTANPVSSKWFSFAMESPIAFHSLVYATTLHVLNAHNGQELTSDAPVLRLSHKVTTINLIKESLATLTGPPTDALLMAVIVLTIHGHRDDTVYLDVHPQSPLAKAQFLNVYGNMIHDEAHFKWIVYLIAHKGGLDAIELYGFADIVALCDIYFASKYVCPAVFPLRRPPINLVDSGKHIHDSLSIELDARLGNGFKFLHAIPGGNLLIPILEAFCQVTVALDHYSRGGPTAPDMVDLVEARNSAQHQLLSQMPPPDVETSDGPGAIIQACRLATLVFSDMVIFPVPPMQGVKPRLASMLKKALEGCAASRNGSSYAYMLLWATSLGAISASFTPDRPWYVEQLSQQVLLLGIDQWSSMEFALSKFLWWSPVCNEPGEKLWREVCSSL